MNPFSVGQEYSGYYMDGQSCPESGHANQYHIFNDTRLDSTGPDGRIKDRTLIGDMERGREAGLDKEKQTVILRITPMIIFRSRRIFRQFLRNIRIIPKI